ncbi:MAG: DUF159 family protein [Porticoccaceae bacterium]|nr:MAG: DUF159 family protein [Porticoccaceae bacterium]
MCGRFNLTDLPGLAALLDALGIHHPLPPPRANIAPSEEVLLLHDGTAEEARWWFVPHWAPEPSTRFSTFNARAESLSRSRAFAAAFRRQRGVVPMSSFLEWRREGRRRVPWRVRRASGVLAAAAVWDRWGRGAEAFVSCAVVTVAAPPAFAPWHARMPLLLADDELARWLDNAHPVAADDALFRPALKFPLRLAPLSPAVNDARRKDPALMEPVGAEVELPPPGE